ncbi:hypothetical protein [Microbacterium sp. 18062]|uniref:hypothetical protein n=1 Tax=Microbacterium sp. 18062 TaxID=2681410 RepID=UPI00135B6DA9|nr:hypothetical protein [Microbacterium sp. 18062]
MSDGLTISSGGAIAVDTAALEAAAASLDTASETLAEAAGELALCAERLGGRALPLLGAYGHARRLAEVLSASAATAGELAAKLRFASATYALVELRVAHGLARATGDEAEIARTQGGIDALLAEWPDADAAASDALSLAGLTGRDAALQLLIGGIVPSLLGFGLLPLLAFALSGVRRSGLGTVGAARPLAPGGTAATLVPQFVSQRGTAPTTLADAAARIPASGPARVRIEQYARPDGGRSFAVYIAGTRALGGDDPWDMSSNLESFAGSRSDALATVEAALESAGAQPGDELYLFGHSQGAMIAGQVQQSGVYEVPVLGGFGSPTAVDPGEQTFSVQVRHGDDPVAALAIGHEARVGAEGSFVAERTVDPAMGMHDLTLPAHHLDTYIDTAATADASGDPRALALHERLAPLAEADLVRVVEYGAERAAGPVLAPGRRPDPGPDPSLSARPMALGGGFPPPP